MSRTLRRLAVITAAAGGLAPLLPAAPAVAETRATCTAEATAISGMRATTVSVDVRAHLIAPRTAVRVVTSPLDRGDPRPGAIAATPMTDRISLGLQLASDDYSLYTIGRSGRLTAHQRTVSDLIYDNVHTDTGWRSTTLAKGLAHARGLAAGQHLYVLDGGRLQRFTTTGSDRQATARPTGSARGYSTYRALTLLRQEPGRDVLLATTTKGALVTITVPTGTRFAPSLNVLQRTGWATTDAVTTDTCGTSTALIAADTRTGRAQALRLDPPRTRTDTAHVGTVVDIPTPLKGLLTTTRRIPNLG